MLKNAIVEDQKRIYELYRHTHCFQNLERLEYYSQKRGILASSIVFEQDALLVSSLSYSFRRIKFMNRVLKVSAVDAFAVHPDYRYQSVNAQLMQSFLEQMQQETLFTIVGTEYPKLYEKYGFRPLYNQHKYVLKAEYFSDIPIEGVEPLDDLHAMKKVYENFTQHFQGIAHRSVEEFQEIFDAVTYFDDRVIGAYNSHGELRGYCIYHIEKDRVLVKEIVYLDGRSLAQLLQVAVLGYQEIEVTLSKGEQLQKLFPLAIPRQKLGYMIRLNNPELFNKLFKTQVKCATSAYAILQQPIHFLQPY
ncbi:MAG: GNAT family N-acetyltransferase [Erysipelotrichaceae bacterium]